MIKRSTLLILSFLTLALVSCSDGTPDLEGIYNGRLMVIDEHDPLDLSSQFTDPNSVMTIIDCGDNCFELTVQHDWGFNSTNGTYSTQESFYSLDIEPILDPSEPGNQAGFENGVGTFNFETSELNLSFLVTDGSEPLGTDSVFTFEGIK